jgi:hypothetical protein
LHSRTALLVRRTKVRVTAMLIPSYKSHPIPERSWSCILNLKRLGIWTSSNSRAHLPLYTYSRNDTRNTIYNLSDKQKIASYWFWSELSFLFCWYGIRNLFSVVIPSSGNHTEKWQVFRLIDTFLLLSVLRSDLTNRCG